MVKVEGYANLTKKQEDLLRLGYCFKSLATFTLLTNASPVTFKTRAAQKTEGNVLASASMKVVQDKVAFTPKRRTDGLSQYTLEYTVNPEVKAKGEIKMTEAGGAKTRDLTASVEYKEAEYAVKAAFVHPNPGVKLSATWLKSNHGVGLDGKFATDSSRFVVYNFATWYINDTQTVVFKHNGSNKTQYAWGELVMSYYRDVSDTKRVCGVAKYDIPKKSTFIEFGGDYQLNKDTTLRGKLNSNGLLGLGLTKKLMSTLNLTIGAQFDTKKVKCASVTDYKFGFKLDFNTVFQ